MLVPFSRLPDDALWRLMGWFGSLRRLSVGSRGKLVERLAGHPRAVEFVDRLVAQAIDRWAAEHGDLEAADPGAEREWREIVAPALPAVEEELSQDLLFGALWDRVSLVKTSSAARTPGSSVE